jgi:3'-phosphoadenosine 5'-phosphosulfate sulfotransferase (PAPS reductase)/FAD synthetase
VAEGEDPRAGRWRNREKTECGLHASTGSTALPFGSREGGLL